MKLYVSDKNGDKVFLEIDAKSKKELCKVIGSEWFSLGTDTYHINDVKAEASGGSTTAGALFGSLLGLLGGPLGVLIGGSIGGAVGNSNDNEEIEEANLFNQSSI